MISSTNRLEIRIISDERAFEAVKQQWIELARISESSVFQTYQWNRTWWRYYGRAGDLFLVTLWDETVLVGLAPFFWDRISLLGRAMYSCLRLIGSNVSQPEGDRMMGLISYTDYLDILVRPGYEDPVCERLVTLFGSIRADVDEIILDAIPESGILWKRLKPHLDRRDFRYVVLENAPSQLITLDGTWEQYLNGLNKNRRYKIRRSLKQAEDGRRKVFDIRRIDNRDEILRAFDRLVHLHQRQWNRSGTLGAFFEQKDLDFHREMVIAFHETGWLQLLTATPVGADDYIAVDINYKYKNRIYGVHTATDKDSPYSKMGPGSTLLAATLALAAKEGVQAYDFLRGYEDYKLSSANGMLRNRTVLISPLQRGRNRLAEWVKNLSYLKRRGRRKWNELLLLLKRNTLILVMTLQACSCW